MLYLRALYSMFIQRKQTNHTSLSRYQTIETGNGYWVNLIEIIDNRAMTSKFDEKCKSIRFIAILALQAKNINVVRGFFFASYRNRSQEKLVQ